VIVGGAELFTGNNLIAMGFASGVVTYKQLLKNWVISYIVNFLGSLSMVFLFYLTGLWKIKDFLLGAKSLQIAAEKVNLGFLEAFTRGILCNALVCLAVWLCFSSRSVVGKISAIIFPIAAFVASGFKHSIANMYFIHMGILLKNNVEVTELFYSLNPEGSLYRVSLWGFGGNLLPVTLGNIVGGAVMVGVVYWLIIVLPERLKKKRVNLIK